MAAKKKKKAAPRGYGAIGGYNGLNPSRATSIVDGQIAALIAQLQGDLDQGTRRTNEALNKEENLYGRSVGDLNYIRDEVGDAISGNNRKIDSAYGSAIGQGRLDTQRLMGEQQGQSHAAKQAMMQELARLGIQQASQTDRFDADALNSQQLGQQMGANNEANMSLARGMANDVGGMLGSMAQGSYQSHSGRVLNTRNDNMGNIRDDDRARMEDIYGQMRNTRAQRGSQINQLMESMLASDYDRWLSTQKLAMERQQMNAALGGGGGGGGGGSRGYGSSRSYGSSGAPKGYVAAPIKAPARYEPPRHMTPHSASIQKQLALGI